MHDGDVARFGRLVSEPHSFIETNKQHEKRISRTLIGRTFPNGISIKDSLACKFDRRHSGVVGKTAGNG